MILKLCTTDFKKKKEQLKKINELTNCQGVILLFELLMSLMRAVSFFYDGLRKNP